MSNTPFLEWPSSAFYWGLLDTSIFPSGKAPTEEQLCFLLEPLIPVDLEELHVVFAQVAPGSVLGCALARKHLEAVPPGALTLTPKELPAPIGDLELPADSLNFLTGPYTPAPISRLRTQTRVGLLAAWVLLSGLLSLGLWRRAQAMETAASEAYAARDEGIRETLALGSAPSSTPLPLLLEAESRRLQQTRKGPEADLSLPSATEPLAALLSHWPASAETQTGSIVSTGTKLHVRTVVETNAKAELLSKALEQVPNWQAGVPSLRRTQNGFSVLLAFTPAAEVDQ